MRNWTTRLAAIALIVIAPSCLRDRTVPQPRGLTGSIGKMELWGFDGGEWWEVGSGQWTQQGSALQAIPGQDPSWTWISSPHPYPEEFELTFDVYGEAELVGIGFGPFKDFLIAKPARPDPIAVRFVLEEGVGRLQADGVTVVSPPAVQKSIRDGESLRDGRLQLKVFQQDGPVRFDRLALKELPPR